MKKYGLQLRIPPAQKKKPEPSHPLARPSLFGDDDDDDVEREISRQASKNKALLRVEEQHKKALEEDPSVFDYDGVYDEMKEQIARPRAQDRVERKSKYIERLMEKAKEREREHEVIYERKLLKERSKEDHLFADKEKFVTSGYKKKLAEQAKWLEEEKLRQIREEKEDVTKKTDLSDFYFGLHKNIALGGQLKEAKKPTDKEQTHDRSQDVEGIHTKSEAHVHSTQDREESSGHSGNHYVHAVTETEVTVPDATSAQEKAKVVQEPSNELPAENFKRSGDVLSEARERYLARKRAKEQ